MERTADLDLADSVRRGDLYDVGPALECLVVDRVLIASPFKRPARSGACGHAQSERSSAIAQITNWQASIPRFRFFILHSLKSAD